MNYTTDQIKTEEFLRKCYEHSDFIHQGRTAPVVITTVQLEFYNMQITEVLKVISENLKQLEEPAHPHDSDQIVWSVWCQRNGDKYVIQAKTKLVDKSTCKS
jgi:hypothetical protein